MPWAAAACAVAGIVAAQQQSSAAGRMHFTPPPKPRLYERDLAAIERETQAILRMNQRGVYLLFALFAGVIGVAVEWLPRLV